MNHSRLFQVVLASLLSAAPVPASGSDGAVSVTFSLSAPHASSVAVAGSFNRWDSSGHRLAGPDQKGTWSITLPLAPGRYEYLYVINGSEWTPDPAALTTSDGMGGRNSVITVVPP